MKYILQYQSEILLGLSIGFVFLLLTFIVSIHRQRKLKHRLDRISDGLQGVDLEKMLAMMQKDINDLQTGNILREDKIRQLQKDLSFTIRKVGFLRYNAFSDTVSGRGGELSFSIAFLDGYNNGFVLSSIYGSSCSVSYAKPIRNKESTIPLSEEEILAIEKAIRGDSIE